MFTKKTIHAPQGDMFCIYDDEELVATFEAEFEDEAEDFVAVKFADGAKPKRTILHKAPDLNTYISPERTSTLDILAGVAGNLLEILQWHKSNGKPWPLDAEGDDTREYTARLLVMQAKYLLTQFEGHDDPADTNPPPVVDDLPF
jgi:hypothetical protein